MLDLHCCAWAFSSCCDWGLLFNAGFLLRWLLLLQSTGSRLIGFRICESWALEHCLSSIQLLIRVWLFATPWTAAHQANSGSFLKFMSIESMMPSSHLILCRPLLLLPSIFPTIREFEMSQFFASGGQSIGASASTSVLPMNIQDWSPLGWTDWISLPSKGLSRVFSNTTVQRQERWLSHVLSCPSACGIFLDQKSNPCPLH